MGNAAKMALVQACTIFCETAKMAYAMRAITGHHLGETMGDTLGETIGETSQLKIKEFR